MSKLTSNYNFVKPELTDIPDITVISDNLDLIDSAIKEEANTNKEYIDNQIIVTREQLGSPLVAHTVSEMEDETHIYVYVGSETGYTAGNWYYYDGSDWVSGGVYNSEGIQTDKTLTVPDMAADAEVVGNEITDLKSDSLYLSRYVLTAKDYLSIDGHLDFNGDVQSSPAYYVSDFIKLNKGDTIEYRLRAGSGSSHPIVVIYYLNKNLYGRPAYGAGSDTDVTGSWTANNDYYVRICCLKNYENPLFVINSYKGLLDLHEKTTHSENYIAENDNLINKNNVLTASMTSEKIQTSAYGQICFTKLIEGETYVFYKTISDNRICTIGFAQGTTNGSLVTGYKYFNINYKITEQKDEFYPYKFTVPVGYPYLAVYFYVDNGEETKYTKSQVLDSLYLRHVNDVTDEVTQIGNKTGCVNPIYSVFDDEVDRVSLEIGQKAISKSLLLGIITDTHIKTAWDSYNNVSMENMRRVNEKQSFDIVINMGDLIDGGSEKSIERHFMQKGMERIINVGAKKFAVLVGNHDNNGLSVSSEWFSPEDLYGMMLRHYDTEVVRNGISYNSYIDYPEIKIRVAFVDSVYQTKGFSQETISWVTNILNNLPQGYRIVFISHEPTRASLISTNSTSMPGSEDLEVVLTTHVTKICGWIHGHTHFDNVSYVMTFPEISITCGKPDQFPSTNFPTGAVAPERIIGDVSQDAWDSVLIMPDDNKFEFIRFGAGNSRTVPFRE